MANKSTETKTYPSVKYRKMIHQWKNRGINDPTVTKLLDLHLGMPAYMNESGIYPLCKFLLHQNRTQILIYYCTDNGSDRLPHIRTLFGMKGTQKSSHSTLLYGIIKVTRKQKNVQQDSAQKTPQDSAQDSAFF